MAFDLTKAIGFDAVSKLDTREIEMIPIDKIDVNENNFFVVDDVQDLKESIEVNGVLQPINVVQAGDRFRIIAGHRRFKAASELGLETIPAIVLPEMSEAMEQLALIQTNTTARELSYPEKMEAAKQLKTILINLKEEGVELPGKLRDIMAEQLEISRTELARMNVIENGLSDAWKEKLREGKINAHCAYALARVSAEDQNEIFEKVESGEIKYLYPDDIKNFVDKKAAEDWLKDDCKFAIGYWANELRDKGEKVPCEGWKRVRDHKEKGHPEKCCGCCGECENLHKCKDACDEAKRHKENLEQNKKYLETEKAEMAAFTDYGMEEICKRFKCLMQELCYDEDDVHELIDMEYSRAGAPSYWSSPAMHSFVDAKKTSSMPRFIMDMLAFCKALDVDANWFLGVGRIGGWHDFTADDKPMNGQRVIVRRRAVKMTAYGEYIYRDGEWFTPEFDDVPMNVTGVTHWIEVPE